MERQALFINPDPVSMAPEELFDEGLLTQARTIIERGITTDEQWTECQRVSDSVKDQRKKVEATRKLKVGPFNEVVKAINDWFRPYTTALDDLEDKLGKLYIRYYNDREERRKAAEMEATRIKAAKEAAAAEEKRKAEVEAEVARKKAETEARKLNKDSLFGDEVEVRMAEQKPAEFAMQPVVSSNVDSVGYDASGQRMAIQFKNLKRYIFKNVPEPIFKSVVQAKSVGIAFNQIIKGKYDIEAIEAVTPTVSTPAPVAPEPLIPAPLKPAAPIRKIWKARITNPALVPREFCVPSNDLIMAAHEKGISEITGVEFYVEEILTRSQG